MPNIVGKTVKIPGYDVLELVGVIATVDKVKQTGLFVGYLNLPFTKVDKIKCFTLEFKGGTYDTAEQFKKDLSKGTVQVDPKNIKSSRMPKELGNVVRDRAKNLQKLANRSDNDIVVNLAKQKEYRKIILESFKHAIVADPDLGDDECDLGRFFIGNKGFYFIEKNEVSGLRKNQLASLSNKAISLLAIFSQDLIRGSVSDYYASALEKGLEDFYLYVEYGELDILTSIKENIKNSATYPSEMNKEITSLLKGYQSLPVKK